MKSSERASADAVSLFMPPSRTFLDTAENNSTSVKLLDGVIGEKVELIGQASS